MTTSGKSQHRQHRAYRRKPRARVPCPLCAHTGRRGSRHRASIESFATAQRELLTTVISSLHIRTRRAFCIACLAALERQLQSRQIVRDGAHVFFVDRLLAPHPIMPTPMRLGAADELTGRGITIAFVDSGFVAHPDFTQPTDRIVAMYDAVRGKSRSTSPQIAEPPISAWHGTMTAASAAGSGYCSNGLYRGIASDARLILISTMTQYGGIHTAQIVRALRWVLSVRERYDIRIVSISVGCDEIAKSTGHPVIKLVEELVEAGVVVVAAAGNGPGVPLMPPASAPSAITVGGYDDQNSTDPRRWSLWYGSHGVTPDGVPKPDVLAPSIWIAAPVLPNTATQREADALFSLAAASDVDIMRLARSLASSTSVAARLREAKTTRLVRSIVHRRIHDEKLITPWYKHVDGTSFAAPLVSSVIAQMLEAQPLLRPADVRDMLTRTSLRLPGIASERQGAGVVQPRAAVEAARALAVAHVPEPDVKPDDDLELRGQL